MVAIIGGEPQQFAPLIDLYRRAGRAGRARAGGAAGGPARASASSATDVAEATNSFYPGWEEMFTTVAAERGGMPPTRRAFDAMRGPDGAFFVGDPRTVAEKVLRVSEQLGGVDRITCR